MTQCRFCGETSYYPTGPHSSGPCPLRQVEHEQRLEYARLEHEARLEGIRMLSRDEALAKALGR